MGYLTRGSITLVTLEMAEILPVVAVQIDTSSSYYLVTTPPAWGVPGAIGLLSAVRNHVNDVFINSPLPIPSQHPIFATANMAPSAISTGINSVSHSSPPPSVSSSTHHPSTLAIHADDQLNRSTDVSPAIHVSTTFRYASNPADLVPAKDLKVRFFFFPPPPLADPHDLNRIFKSQDN